VIQQMPRDNIRTELWGQVSSVHARMDALDRQWRFHALDQSRGFSQAQGWFFSYYMIQCLVLGAGYQVLWLRTFVHCMVMCVLIYIQVIDSNEQCAFAPIGLVRGQSKIDMVRWIRHSRPEMSTSHHGLNVSTLSLVTLAFKSAKA
jgi:hypothetical protein